MISACPFIVSPPSAIVDKYNAAADEITSDHDYEDDDSDDDVTLPSLATTTTPTIGVSSSSSSSMMEVDIVNAMLEKESWPTYDMVACDAVGRGGSTDAGRVDEDFARGWRHQICDWCYGFVDHYGFDREVAAVAMNCFDRYLAKRGGVDHSAFGDTNAKKIYRLVAVSSLHLAIKIHSCCDDGGSVDDGEASKKSTESNNALRASAFVNLCVTTTHDAKVIQDTELELLRALEWAVHPPTMTSFVTAFREALFSQDGSDDDDEDTAASRLKETLLDVARYQVELAVFLPELASGRRYKASVVAFAALLNAVDAVLRRDSSAANSDACERALRVAYVRWPGLVGTRAVVEARTMLKELCPDRSDIADLLEDDAGGRGQQYHGAADIHDMLRGSGGHHEGYMNERALVSPTGVTEGFIDDDYVSEDEDEEESGLREQQQQQVHHHDQQRSHKRARGSRRNGGSNGYNEQ